MFVGSTGILTFTSTADRPWVRLDPARGASLDVSARVLGLTSATNLRDSGGYRTNTGQWVRFGALYRSPALTLSEEDTASVAELGLSDVYDLRTPGAIAEEPDVELAGVRYHELDVLGDLISGSGLPEFTTVEQARQFMIQTERDMVGAASAKSGHRDLLTGLITGAGAGLYHCTAGKDRTGWASAVLLTLLGVDEETVMADYLLSNTHFFGSPAVQAELAAMPAQKREIYEPLMRVEREYLQAGLDRVDEEYGSMEAYAEEGLDLSDEVIERLRERYLVGEPIQKLT